MVKMKIKSTFSYKLNIPIILLFFFIGEIKAMDYDNCLSNLIALEKQYFTSALYVGFISTRKENLVKSDTLFPRFKGLKNHEFYREEDELVTYLKHYELAFVTWKYYKLNNFKGGLKGKLRRLYTIIAIDKESRAAWEIEVLLEYIFSKEVDQYNSRKFTFKSIFMP